MFDSGDMYCDSSVVAIGNVSYLFYVKTETRILVLMLVLLLWRCLESVQSRCFSCCGFLANSVPEVDLVLL